MNLTLVVADMHRRGIVETMNDGIMWATSPQQGERGTLRSHGGRGGFTDNKFTHDLLIQDCLRKLEYCDKVLYFL